MVQYNTRKRSCPSSTNSNGWIMPGWLGQHVYDAICPYHYQDLICFVGVHLAIIVNGPWHDLSSDPGSDVNWKLGANLSTDLSSDSSSDFSTELSSNFNLSSTGVS